MSMLLAGAMLPWVPGCGGEGASKPVPLDVAFNKASPDDPRRGPLTERPAHSMYNDVSIDPLSLKPTPAESDPAAHSNAAPPAGVVAEPVREAIQPPTVEALRAATQTSATSKTANANGVPPATGASTGQHLTLGAVVVEVNNKPIYANDVIEPLTPLLAAKAKQLDISSYRLEAQKEITRMLGRLIQDQLEYAIADRSLDTDEHRVARALTERFREDMVRKAGGSLQVARQQAAAQGVDFDKMVSEAFRVKLWQVYFMKKQFPKVQVTADDMRVFYDRHRNDLFSERAQAQFRVIKIGFKQTGGREQAKTKIDDLRRRAAEGDDFAELATNYNDDAYLIKMHGAVSGEGGWMDRGAYANQKLEDAVWAIEPGQVTPVVESPDAFYIARLEQKKPGRTRSFDDEQVQNQIRKALEKEQVDALREQEYARLKSEAAIYPDPPFLQPALDIAMQNYPAWSGQR
jgi:parvulin-like peptidyl-prolyl isomerase